MSEKEISIIEDPEKGGARRATIRALFNQALLHDPKKAEEIARSPAGVATFGYARRAIGANAGWLGSGDPANVKKSGTLRRIFGMGKPFHDSTNFFANDFDAKDLDNMSELDLQNMKIADDFIKHAPRKVLARKKK